MHPDRLIIERPIEQMRIPRLFQQIGRDARFERTGPHPSGGPHPDIFLDDRRAFLDRARLVLLPHRAEQLGIGAPVAKNVVTARFDLLNEVRVVVADAAVEQDRRGQLELVEHLEQAPVADAVAVIAPGEVARGLLPAAVGGIHPQPGTEGEMLDIERHVERQALAPRPLIARPFDDRRIGVASMAWKLEHFIFSS